MKNNQKIPEGWSLKKIGNILDTFSGGTPLVGDSSYYDNGTIPFIRSGEIHQNYTELFITDKGLNESSAKMVKEGDLLLALYGATSGEIAISKINGAINQAILCMRPREDDILYLEKLFLLSKDKILHKYLQGGQGNLSAEIIKALYFVFPPLPEQEKIAEILGTWDEAIEKLASLIEQKKTLKKGMMQRLLTGKQRLSGFTQPWKEVKLGDISNIYQPQTISQEVLIKNGYPVYGANGLIGYFSKCNHETWQIMITCRGSTCGTVNRSKGPAWITGNAMVINCDNYNVNKLFLYYKLLMERFFSAISGSGQPQIVRSPLLKWKLFNPIDVEEQQAIADVLSTADDEINTLNKKLEALKEQKKGLMQQLLTGKIRVKVN